MRLPSSFPFPQLHAMLAAVWRWRYSMFWTLVPTMFLVSCAWAVALIIHSTFKEDARLRQVFAPAQLRQSVQAALGASTPPPVRQDQLAGWCQDALHLLSQRILSKAMADRAGDDNPNGFRHALDTGRVAVTLRAANGHSCTLASPQVPTLAPLQRQMNVVMASAPATATASGQVSEQADGWTSVLAYPLAGTGGAMLTVGVHILSPLSKLMHPKGIFKSLAIFVFTINALTALVMVLLLVRRLRRIDRVARAWTAGELDARIFDQGRDEISRLARKFDLMADAMSGVIAVKQALAAAEERNRLARDLHDSAKQRAFALNLQLSAAQQLLPPDSDAGRLVEAALSLSGQLQQDLGSVISRLSAPTIAEAGLRHALTDGVTSMLTGSGVRCTVALNGEDEAMLAAMPEVAHQLLLITLEAVANVLKHAGCTQCSISGERSGERYHWRIADNGVAGRPADDRSKGMGLDNMKFRAESLRQGRFEIAGDAGGTVIAISFCLVS